MKNSINKLHCSSPSSLDSLLPSLCRVFILLLIWALPGCATGFTSSTVEDFGTFRIDVANDVAPRVDIFLQVDPQEEGDADSESRLGSAPVEGTTVFRVDLEDPSTPHRLRAALPRNQELLSETFIPGEVAGVLWILDGNVLEREDSGAAPVSDRGEAEVTGAVHRRPTGARLIPPKR